MRTAVILSGALRTIKKTIPYLKKNVLQSDTYDLFICVQNDTAQSNEEWSAWFQEEVGTWLKDYVVWFSPQTHSDWFVQRDRMVEHIIIDPAWKHYLKTSGSMIEYAQLQLAYLKVTHYEQLHRMKYDYIIRTRTDSIYTKPVDFHWLQWTPEEINARLEQVKQELILAEKPHTVNDVTIAFMVTLLSDDVLSNLRNIFIGFQPSPTETPLPETADQIYHYLRKGRYILTLRKNNLYIVRRDLFYLIPSLSSLYGQLRSPCSDDYWFNAEGQFRDACYYSCLDVFDYSTAFEEKSLEYAHQWDSTLFFDDQMNIVRNDMLYCVVRK